MSVLSVVLRASFSGLPRSFANVRYSERGVHGELEGLCTKSHEGPLLCATSVFSVSLWLMNSKQKHTTETQRTQRLHREINMQKLEKSDVA